MRRVVVLGVALCLATTADAQRRDSVQIPLPGPRTLVGFVADQLDRPIAGAEVYITSQGLTTQTGPDGSFRFNDIKPGRYQIGARKLGYYPQGQQVEVGDNGGATAFWLTSRGPFTLPTIVSSAARGGLSGVVGDTAYKIIEGARIWVLASDRRTESDSTGAFFLDLKPGRYMVRVERPGYGSKLVSVTIPRDSGRQVTVWLTPSSGQTRRETQAIMEMSMRLTRRNPVWSKIYTREDILKSGMKTADRFASAGAGKLVPDYCEAIIDGGLTRTPLWVIDAADIETMEVYTSRPARPRNSRSSAGFQNRSVPVPNQCLGTSVYVWLRK